MYRQRKLSGLLFFILISKGHATSCSAGDYAGVNSPGNTHNQNTGNSGEQLIGVSYTIPCCGVVDGWEIYPGATGTLYLQVWRDIGAGYYELVGSNTVTVSSTGAAVTESIASASRINVESGYLLGWYSDDPEIINYDSGLENGYYGATNTILSPGNTSIPLPLSYFFDREYGIKATLGPAALSSGASPTFDNLDGSVTIAWSSAVGDVVFNVTSSDTDVGDVLTTTLDSSSPSADFVFDTTTGVVTVSSGSLTITTYTLTFTVTDSCGDSDTNTLSITVSNTTASSNVIESDSAGFWDEWYNILWVTLTCLAGLALLALLVFCLCKHRPWTRTPKHRRLAVKPVGKAQWIAKNERLGKWLARELSSRVTLIIRFIIEPLHTGCKFPPRAGAC